MEGIKNLIALFRRNTRTIIFYFNGIPSITLFQRDADMVLTIAEGITNQIIQQTVQQMEIPLPLPFRRDW